MFIKFNRYISRQIGRHADNGFAHLREYIMLGPAGVINTPQTALLPNSKGRDTSRSKFTFSEERLDLPSRQRPLAETLITFCQRLVPYNPLILHCSFIRLLSLFGQMCHRIVERFNIAFPRNSLRNWLFNWSQTVRGPNASYRLKSEKHIPHQSRVSPLQSTNQHFNQRKIHMLRYRLSKLRDENTQLDIEPTHHRRGFLQDLPTLFPVSNHSIPKH
mmetsp:Transcript_13995/g.36139  ORF Transcript_13995/g.36139 Transcript_13995/m.36139 type:complete len:217 (+) Transcript_13995:109-759(+)